MTGKVGTDIEENKCSWLVVQALQQASPEQRKILEVYIYRSIEYTFIIVYLRLLIFLKTALGMLCCVAIIMYLYAVSTYAYIHSGKLCPSGSCLCSESQDPLQRAQFGAGIIAKYNHTLLWRTVTVRFFL